MGQAQRLRCLGGDQSGFIVDTDDCGKGIFAGIGNDLRSPPFHILEIDRYGAALRKFFQHVPLIGTNGYINAKPLRRVEKIADTI